MQNRRAVTLIELMVAILIMGIVMAAASNFFIGQSKTFRRGASDAVMLQNIRFGADLLNQHLRSVGANVTDGQPPVIYVDGSVLSFNADYATNTPGDLNAIYFTPKAPNSEVQAMPMASAITVPGQTTVTYPNFDYQAAVGIASPAEMITFWFAPDTETARTDDYVLYRQVNGATPEAVVRNILQDSVPFFRYLYLDDSASTLSIDTIPASSLPLAYNQTTDTLKTRLIANLRAVIVSYIVTNGMVGQNERTRPMTLIVPFPNMQSRALKTCGNSPRPQPAPSVVLDADGHSVDVTWSANGDETGGERDIMAYVLWRRIVGTPSWETPFISIPAGNPPTYHFVDSSVPQDTVDVPWEYAVAAQDCTPSYSDPVASVTAIIVPKAP
jgi:prepilin-type N-terminal cleavage/methylation domain-containing protein